MRDDNEYYEDSDYDEEYEDDEEEKEKEDSDDEKNGRNDDDNEDEENDDEDEDEDKDEDNEDEDADESDSWDVCDDYSDEHDEDIEDNYDDLNNFDSTSYVDPAESIDDSPFYSCANDDEDDDNNDNHVEMTESEADWIESVRARAHEWFNKYEQRALPVFEENPDYMPQFESYDHRHYALEHILKEMKFYLSVLDRAYSDAWGQAPNPELDDIFAAKLEGAMEASEAFIRQLVLAWSMELIGRRKLGQGQISETQYETILDKRGKLLSKSSTRVGLAAVGTSWQEIGETLSQWQDIFEDTFCPEGKPIRDAIREYFNSKSREEAIELLDIMQEQGFIEPCVARYILHHYVRAK